MKFIDTHIHLQDFKFICAKDILRGAMSYGIEKMFCMSAKRADWRAIAELVGKFPEQIIPSFGIHPWYAHQYKSDDLTFLDSLLQKYLSAIVGEIGLDGLKGYLILQQELFFAQLSLAKKHHRPVSIHCVRATAAIQSNWNKLPEKFVFHSYSGKKEFLRQILNHGGYVGFSSAVLQRPETAEIIKFAPMERILLETDAPYQPILQKNENPAEKIVKIANKVAEIKKENLEKLCEQIYKNSLEFVK